MGMKAYSTKAHVFKSRLSVAVVSLCLNHKRQVCLVNAMTAATIELMWYTTVILLHDDIFLLMCVLLEAPLCCITTSYPKRANFSFWAPPAGHIIPATLP